ncbi:TNF receptor-associated factor 6-like isoform X1 [Diaphorina citri]|uniref:TNF receptor-associated factor 6-like isoform X1 n=1 Tax=Diaphorina citri TaxID=121845 RepID=A0A1S4ECZ4_DIACI|nr:TNF receptor-associated factor 6-like isoform X1 [Diaphorina citri]KAI5737226.1 hypothetical protein M8J76_011251 [Diaphorina citri]
MEHQPVANNKLNLDPRFECSICLEYLKDAILTSCGHKFCAACIDSWIDVKGKNYCPIDEKVLTKDDIFIDNYTRREILENNLTCPYKLCSSQLSIPEYESHVNTCYLKYSQSSVEDITDSLTSSFRNTSGIPTNKRNSKILTVTVFPEHLNMQGSSNENFPCKFYQVGCREVFKSQALLEKHYDLKTSFHLELLFNKYCSDGSQSTSTPSHGRQDTSVDNYTRNSTMMNGEHKETNHHAGGTDSHEKQRPVNKPDKVEHNVNNGGQSNNISNTNSSSDSSKEGTAHSPFTKNQKEIEAYLMKNKEHESKLWDPNKNQAGDDKSSEGNCSCKTCGDNSHLLKLVYERMVLLEQSMLEQKIKVNNFELNLKQTEEIEDNVVLKLCNGVYFWKMYNFPAKLKEMKEINRYFYSACFYSSCFGYRFCTRVNISREDAQYLSLFIHLVQGENDDILDWPFVGRIRFTALNTSSEFSITDEIQSDKNFDSFKRPVNFFLNKKAFGFNNFIRVADVLDPGRGFLMEDDTFVIKTQVTEMTH